MFLICLDAPRELDFNVDAHRLNAVALIRWLSTVHTSVWLSSQTDVWGCLTAASKALPSKASFGVQLPSSKLYGVGKPFVSSCCVTLYIRRASCVSHFFSWRACCHFMQWCAAISQCQIQAEWEEYHASFGVLRELLLQSPHPKATNVHQPLRLVMHVEHCPDLQRFTCTEKVVFKV